MIITLTIKPDTLKLVFWWVYVMLIFVSARNVLADDWLVTMPVIVLSSFLILLSFLKDISSTRSWNAIVAFMGGLVLTAVILRKVVWEQEYPALDGRVLFLIGLALLAILGRVNYMHRQRSKRRRNKRHRSKQSNVQDPVNPILDEKLRDSGEEVTADEGTAKEP